ncbi:MAG: HIT family protein [Candidatus Lokiarchaeota archaeon]|nr:HIT family protein [Candidatus Lokiarchaeota archaeon]
MLSNDDCIFCKIIVKEIPSKILYQNKDTIAFLDIFPISQGHTIVIPKKHYTNLETIPINELHEVMVTVKIVSNLIYKNLNIDGYNILQNNYKAAGQVINHFHIHIIPRSSADGKFKLVIPREQATEEELDQTLKIISDS